MLRQVSNPSVRVRNAVRRSTAIHFYPRPNNFCQEEIEKRPRGIRRHHRNLGTEHYSEYWKNTAKQSWRGERNFRGDGSVWRYFPVSCQGISAFLGCCISIEIASAGTCKSFDVLIRMSNFIACIRGWMRLSQVYVGSSLLCYRQTTTRNKNTAGARRVFRSRVSYRELNPRLSILRSLLHA